MHPVYITALRTGGDIQVKSKLKTSLLQVTSKLKPKIRRIYAFFRGEGLKSRFRIAAVLADIVHRLRETWILLLHHLLQQYLRITGVSDRADHLPDLCRLRHLCRQCRCCAVLP